jgi:hypothetical protein
MLTHCGKMCAVPRCAETRNTRKWIVDYTVRADGGTNDGTNGGTNGGTAVHRKGEFGRRKCWQI